MNLPTETILIVEDEPADVEFLQRAFAKAGLPSPVRAVTNGEEAVAYLTAHPPFSDRKAFPFPRLIITDLKMPQMDGIQLLRWIQQNPSYRFVPTIVLTSSTAQTDVDAAFAAGASAYLVKPVEIKELDRMAKIISEYWRLTLLPLRAG